MSESASSDLYDYRMQRLVDLWHATPGLPMDGGFVTWFMAGCPPRLAEPEPKPAKPARPKRQRKPSIRRSQIARAEKAAGKPVTSITTAEGITFHFATPDKPGNALDEWLETRRAH
jgi:hypothetical protein